MFRQITIPEVRVLDYVFVFLADKSGHDLVLVRRNRNLLFRVRHITTPYLRLSMNLHDFSRVGSNSGGVRHEGMVNDLVLSGDDGGASRFGRFRRKGIPRLRFFSCPFTHSKLLRTRPPACPHTPSSARSQPPRQKGDRFIFDDKWKTLE